MHAYEDSKEEQLWESNIVAMIWIWNKVIVAVQMVEHNKNYDLIETFQIVPCILEGKNIV